MNTLWLVLINTEEVNKLRYYSKVTNFFTMKRRTKKLRKNYKVNK